MRELCRVDSWDGFFVRRKLLKFLSLSSLTRDATCTMSSSMPSTAAVAKARAERFRFIEPSFDPCSPSSISPSKPVAVAPRVLPMSDVEAILHTLCEELDVSISTPTTIHHVPASTHIRIDKLQAWGDERGLRDDDARLLRDSCGDEQ